MSYKIRTKTFEGNKLTFHNVERYEAKNGLLYFKDSKTGKIKIFSVANSEIELESDNRG